MADVAIMEATPPPPEPTMERPAKRARFSCDVDGCNYTTSKLGNLTRHKRTHTGDKPFIWLPYGKQQALPHSGISVRVMLCDRSSFGVRVFAS